MLHVPVGANSFGKVTPSTSGRPASAFGTSVAAVVGSKGSWVQIGADLTDDAYGVLINFNSVGSSGASREYIVDFGVDEAGGASYIIRIADLLAGGAAAYTAGGSGIWYYFPLFIPAGSSVAVRAQGTVTNAIRCCMQFMQLPANPAMVRKGSFVETLGVGGTAGTSFTPGTTTESSWQLVGTTSKRCWWWQVGIQWPVADIAWVAAVIHIDVAVGDGTNFDIIIQDMPITATSAEVMTNIPITAGVEWDVPSGSNIYVRGQTSGTAELITAAVYGLGG